MKPLVRGIKNSRPVQRLGLYAGALAVVVASVLVCRPAYGQTLDTPSVISPLRSDPDVNGVNLADGRIQPPMPVLSVPAAPRLKFDQVQNAAPYVRGSISGADPQVANWTVHYGLSESDSFECNEDIYCQSTKESGSTIKFGGKNLTQAGTGAKYFFGAVSVHSQPNGQPKIDEQDYLTTITYPDGEIITYGYYSVSQNGAIYYRPARISTNRGYYITITYSSTAAFGDPAWNTPTQVAIFQKDNPSTPLAQFIYGAGGSITDLAGRVFYVSSPGANTLGINNEAKSVSERLPTESASSFDVTSTNDLISSVVRDGVGWSYSYTNPVYRPATDKYSYDKLDVTGPNGFHKSYTFTPGQSYYNILTSETDELSRKTSYSYDHFDRLSTISYPEGNSVTIAYDLAGNVASRTLTSKIAGQPALVEQVYVDTTNCTDVLCFRPVWHRDALNRETDYTYNTAGQVTSILEPADEQGVRRKTVIQYATYDTGSGVISRMSKVWICGEPSAGPSTDCSGADLRTEYQYFGATSLPTVVTEIAQATGETHSTTISYDLAGRVLSVDGPLAGTSDTHYSRYDTLGRKTWEIGELAPNGLYQAKRYTYRDADDKVLSVESGTLTDPASVAMTVLDRVDSTYDSRRYGIRAATSAGGQAYLVTDRSYLDRGLLNCTAVRMNPQAAPTPTSTSACSLGTQGTQGPDRIEFNSYDTAGQLTSIKRAYGTPLVQTYAAYAYTANGKQQFVTDANLNKAQFAYDGYDRQSYWYFPSKTAAGSVNTADYEQYGYDAVGNRTSLRRRDGRTLTFAYNGRNLLISKIVPDGCAPIQQGGCTPAVATRDVYYTYDIMNRQLSARYDSKTGADGTTNGYNAFGNLTSSAISMAGFSKTLTSLYDAAGNRIRLTHPDGQAFTYAYDALSRLSGLYEGAGTTTSLDQFTYNPRGNIDTRQERYGSSVAYGYDAIGRLANYVHGFVSGTNNVSFSALSYNPASQLVGRNRDNDNYGWADSVTLSRNYAANGLNQYTTAGSASFTYDANGNLVSDGTNTYVYDAENRLVSASNGTTLTYDPTGRLWEVVKGSADTRFLYDGDALVGEFNSAGTLTARYVHGSNLVADDPLIWYCSGTAACWLHSDHEGSIIAVTNASGGAPSINTYDEYGVPGGLLRFGLPGAGNTGRFQFTGQTWIPEVGLYYYKARIYSPILGRFLQIDPIGYKDQMDLYSYVANDPIDRNDPTGTAEANTCSRVGSASCSGTYSAGGSMKATSLAKRLAAMNRAIDPVHVLSAGIGLISGEGTDSVEASINDGLAHPVSVLAGLPPIIPGTGEVSGMASEAEAATSAAKNLLGRVTADLAKLGFNGPRIQEIIGWGSRASGASARLEGMDAAAAAAGVREAGMTRNMIRGLRDGYQDAVARNRGVGVAPLRVEILNRILEGW